MIKYILFAFLAIILAFGFWFYQQPGPQKLDLLDRYWADGARFDGSVKTEIPYGADARQKLDVYTPSTAGPHPILIFFHGGSWRDGDRAGYGFLGRAFAARGIITIIADYRKIPKNIFPDFVEDSAAAIVWANKHGAEYGGDPRNLFVIGHSAGAHIAMLSLLDKQWLVRLGEDSHIVRGIIGLAGPYDFLPFTTDAARQALGQWPRPAETQPITYARGDAPAMLLLTGDTDVTVKPRNSVKLAAAINQLGGEAAIKIYPNVDHSRIIMAISQPFRGSAPVIDDVLAFIKDHPAPTK